MSRIYLHAELQRQLISLLRNLGPDIAIATHSVEIITEAEPDDIVLINKKKANSKRIKRPSELSEVFSVLGSGLNPTLTQLAKTRRAVFVEGKDFQIISRFARKLGYNAVANRSDFAVVPVQGFNPERVRNIKLGMETTLGGPISAAAVFDRDYRSEDECTAIASECEKFCKMVVIHGRKEIENFLIVPTAIDRAAASRIADHARRTNSSRIYNGNAAKVVEEFAFLTKSQVQSRYLDDRKRFERKPGSSLSDVSITQASLEELETLWNTAERVNLLPGKEVMNAVNEYLQKDWKISVTQTGIVDAMRNEEIPVEMISLIEKLAAFAKSKAS